MYAGGLEAALKSGGGADASSEVVDLAIRAEAARNVDSHVTAEFYLFPAEAIGAGLADARPDAEPVAADSHVTKFPDVGKVERELWKDFEGAVERMVASAKLLVNNVLEGRELDVDGQIVSIEEQSDEVDSYMHAKRFRELFLEVLAVNQGETSTVMAGLADVYDKLAETRGPLEHMEGQFASGKFTRVPLDQSIPALKVAVANLEAAMGGVKAEVERTIAEIVRAHIAAKLLEHI